MVVYAFWKIKKMVFLDYLCKAAWHWHPSRSGGGQNFVRFFLRKAIYRLHA